MIPIRLKLIAAIITLSLASQNEVAGAQEPVRVEFEHAKLSSVNPKPVVLREKRDVWVVIKDANTLIYSYTLGATQLTPDPSARADFERLLNAKAAAPAPEVALAAAKPDSFQTFAENVLTVADVLQEQFGVAEDNSIAVARANVEKVVSGYNLSTMMSDATLMTAKLDELYAKLTDDKKKENEALYRVTKDGIPAVVRWRREFLLARDGVVQLLYEYPGDGQYLVELSVTNRLGDAYTPHRFVGKGADVAVAYPKMPVFQMSFGLTGLFGDRVEGELVKVSAAASPVDTFEVKSKTIDKLSLLPSTFFSMQHQVKQLWSYGLGLGIGLRSDDIESIGQATDLMAVFTVGYDWLRISGGRAYTSEVTSFNGTFAKDGVDASRQFTTDPNGLQRANRTRQKRWLLAIHMTR